jgi:hypothetical protein
MAKRLLKNNLIKSEDINEQLTLISGSQTCYITPTGNVYVDYGDGLFFKKKLTPNKVNGYIYCGIDYDGKIISKRVHKLVAEAFVPNPNNYPIVMHLDNQKTNNNSSNLKWGTVSMNTTQAYQDGLAANAKGFDDSQSIPVCYFDLDLNYLGKFGSIREAAKSLSLTPILISQQCKNHGPKTKPRKGYYFRYLDEYNNCGFVL